MPAPRSIKSTITFVVVLFLYCVTVTPAYAMPPFEESVIPAEPDYAQNSSWLAQPGNPDEHPVDIFWVYPTVLMDKENWLMNIASSTLQKAAQNTLVTQASIFDGQANIYAPLYRQINMAALSLPPADLDRLMSYGKDDVWKAFNYYLEHLNKGRPFILAAHSQGSNILTELVLKHWGKTGAEKRLVAAYLIGWSITESDLQTNQALQLCENATQINCFVTYNTVAPGRQKMAPTIKSGSKVVNPLTWRTDGEMAPASMNLGARFFDESGKSKVYPQFTSAQCSDSGLVVEPADPSLVPSSEGGFPEGVFHKYDYSLFFENLRQNVADRIAAFMK